MKLRAITVLTCLLLAATAVAQGASKDKASSSAPATKAQLSEVRSIVSELEKAGSKLSGLITDYRSMMEQRPQSRGASADAKKAQDDQLARWEAAVERLLNSLEKTHLAVVETTKRLDQATHATLPTSLAKDVATARNAADAARVAAEQVLSKRKPKKASARRTDKSAPKADPADAHLLDDL